MADIDLTRVHNLGMEAARAKAERMAEQLGRKFDLKGTWAGNVLKFERPGVSGSLAVTGKDVHLVVSLGFLLKAMKGSIERAVLQELDTLFGEPTSEVRGTGSAGKPAATPKKAPASPKKGD
jgi:putative polyhydroxyalkanoate system protein